jgi:hypothetical protein
MVWGWWSLPFNEIHLFRASDLDAWRYSAWPVSVAEQVSFNQGCSLIFPVVGIFWHKYSGLFQLKADAIAHMFTGWWLGTFFHFHNLWDRPSHCPIFFKMIKTTNQIYIFHFYMPCCRSDFYLRVLFNRHQLWGLAASRWTRLRFATKTQPRRHLWLVPKKKMFVPLKSSWLRGYWPHIYNSLYNLYTFFWSIN